jgi:hypothetical protein
LEEAKKLGILKEVFGQCHKSGSEWLFHCPKCNHRKSKLSVNIEKNVFKCWVCSYRGNSIYRLVRKHGGFLHRQAWEALGESIDLSTSLYEELFGEPDKATEEQTLKLPKEFQSLANKTLPFSAIGPMKYLKSRGITKEDIVKWKIGYCSRGDYASRIIIPSFNLDGRVNYFIARSYNDDWKKYKNPPSLSKDIIFNHLYVDWKNDLVIVEGAFDAVKAGNAIPLLQSSLREDSVLFQEIVKHDTPVYIALDPEAEKEAMTLIRNLLLYGVEVHKIDVSGFEDVGAMDKEEFEQRKAQAIEMNNENLLEQMAEGTIV